MLAIRDKAVFWPPPSPPRPLKLSGRVPALREVLLTGDVLQASHDGGTEAHQHSHQSGNAKRNGNVNKRSQKNKGPAAGPEFISDAVLSGSRPTTSDSKNSGQSQPEIKKKRGNSNARRGNNKSEPSGLAANGSKDDRQNDEPSQNQPRRLPTVGTDATNQAASGQGHRHPWYPRRRKVAQSETLSGEASGAWSSDTLHPSTNETSLDSANVADSAAATRPSAT